MPLAPSGYAYGGEVVEAFFDNLLPDNIEIRRRIKRRFSAASLSPFDLLEQIGRDCVGAVQLLPDDETLANTHRIEGKVLDESAVEALLGRVTTSVLGRSDSDESFRISIPGAQEKTALLMRD